MSERTPNLVVTMFATVLSLQPACSSASPLISNKPLVAPVVTGTSMAAAKATVTTLPPELQRVRKRLLIGKRVSYREVQALADYGDSIGAFRMGERLIAINDPTLATDALHYFSIAAYQNRGYAVRHMVEILSRTDVKITPAHLAQAEGALRAQALRGNAKAIDSLIRFYSEGSPFGAKADQLEALFKTSADGHNAQSAFRMAVTLLSDPGRTSEQTEQAARYLEIAKESGSIGVQASAGNLLATLGNPQTQDNSGVQP